MHDPTLSPEEKLAVESPLLHDFVRESVIAVMGYFKCPEAKAVSVVGYAMKIKNEFISCKELIAFVDATSKKKIEAMTEDEKQMLLATGFLIRKLPPFRSSTKNIGRNDQCPCGSQAKFKNCCLAVAKTDELARYKNGK